MDSWKDAATCGWMRGLEYYMLLVQVSKVGENGIQGTHSNVHRDFQNED